MKTSLDLILKALAWIGKLPSRQVSSIIWSSTKTRLSSSPGFPAYGFNKDLVPASQRKLAHSEFYITPGGRANTVSLVLGQINRLNGMMYLVAISGPLQ